MENLIFYLLFMYIGGMLTFSLKHKHLLCMLLSLEMMVLSVYLSLFMNLSFFMNCGFISIVFLTFSVCEGVLGLSIMISLIRTHGNDYFQSFNVLW